MVNATDSIGDMPQLLVPSGDVRLHNADLPELLLRSDLYIQYAGTHLLNERSKLPDLGSYRSRGCCSSDILSKGIDDLQSGKIPFVVGHNDAIIGTRDCGYDHI